MVAKFRQAIKGTGELPFRWHYWGYVEEYPHDFISPMGRVDWDDRPSFQFTGLPLMRGKEVWEGDIIKADDGAIGVVEYVAPSFVYKWNDSKTTRDLGERGDTYPDAEVIGNCTEHKGLLEKKNE